MTHSPRPVLLVDSDPGLMTVTERALADLSPGRAVMLLPQYSQVRQYLIDSSRRSRHPAAIVLRGSSLRTPDPAVQLLEWLREQPGDLCATPVVVVRHEPATSREASLIVTIVEAPEQLTRALARALQLDVC